MRLFLHHDLFKGDSSDGGGDPTGEQRGGSYVARVQTGYEKDGSPQYRYFKNSEEYRKYLESKGKSKDKNKDKKKDRKESEGKGKERHLKSKLKEEHEESRKKQEDTQGKVNLFVKDKANREAKKKVKKSIDLFIWRLE